MTSLLRSNLTLQPVNAPVAAPGRRELLQPVLIVWVVLAGLSLVCAIAWRIAGTAPALPLVLDGVGLLLWLSALGLAPAWQALLRRRGRHGRPGLTWTAAHLRDVRFLLAAAELLALAPLGLLLAYDSRTVLSQIEADGISDIPVWLGLWLPGVLLLAGTAIIITAVALLHLCRLLAGGRWGTAVWLLLTVVANRTVIIGETLPLARLGADLQLGGGAALRNLPGSPVSIPLTLGEYAQWTAAWIFQTTQNSVFFVEWLFYLVRDPLVLLLGGLIILASITWPGRTGSRHLPPYLLAALAGTAAVALRSYTLAWHWTGDTSRLFPGDWLATFSLGVAATWLGWLAGVFIATERPARLEPAGLAWCLYAVGTWVVLAWPHVEAGQVTQGELLITGTVTLPVLTAGVLLLHRLARAVRPERQLDRALLLTAAAAVLLLPWPLGSAFSSPALYGLRRLIELAIVPANIWATSVATGALSATCLRLWPWRGNRGRRRTATPQPSA